MAEKDRAELKELSELDLEAEAELVEWGAEDPEVSVSVSYSSA